MSKLEPRQDERNYILNCARCNEEICTCSDDWCGETHASLHAQKQPDGRFAYFCETCLALIEEERK